MTDLSPAARAVMDAYLNAPLHVDSQMANRLGIASAIRAAADQLSYKLPFEDDGRVDVSDLLAIATELEGQ